MRIGFAHPTGCQQHPVSQVGPWTSNLTFEHTQLLTQDEDLDLFRPLRPRAKEEQLKQPPKRPIDQRDHDPKRTRHSDR